MEHFLQVKLTRKMYMCWQKNTWKSWWTSTSYCFLFQELVSDNLIGRTQPVFQFLCPLDKLLNEEEHYQGVWGILSSLAYFLTPGHEEEEVKIRRSAFLQVDILKPGSNFWLSFLSVIVRLKSCLTGGKKPSDTIRQTPRLDKLICKKGRKQIVKLLLKMLSGNVLSWFTFDLLTMVVRTYSFPVQ